MADLPDIFERIWRLVDQLDEDDFEFRAGADARSVRSGVSTRPNSGIRPTRHNRRTHEHEKGGREKFANRRKVKKLNRLLKKAEREGYDIADLIDDGSDKPLVRVEDETIYVDRPNAELDWREGESTVVVEVDDEVVTKDVPFTVTSVEREVNGWMTTFYLNTDE
jgi:hypothetical protein